MSQTLTFQANRHVVLTAYKKTAPATFCFIWIQMLLLFTLILFVFASSLTCGHVNVPDLPMKHLAYTQRSVRRLLDFTLRHAETFFLYPLMSICEPAPQNRCAFFFTLTFPLFYILLHISKSFSAVIVLSLYLNILNVSEAHQLHVPP